LSRKRLEGLGKPKREKNLGGQGGGCRQAAKAGSSKTISSKGKAARKREGVPRKTGRAEIQKAKETVRHRVKAKPVWKGGGEEGRIREKARSCVGKQLKELSKKQPGARAGENLTVSSTKKKNCGREKGRCGNTESGTIADSKREFIRVMMYSRMIEGGERELLGAGGLRGGRKCGQKGKTGREEKNPNQKKKKGPGKTLGKEKKKESGGKKEADTPKARSKSRHSTHNTRWQSSSSIKKKKREAGNGKVLTEVKGSHERITVWVEKP